MDRTSTRIRARGFAEVAALVWSRTRENLWSSDELIFCAVDPATVMPIERDDLVFKTAGAEDAAHYARDVGTDSERTFRARIDDRETRCFLVAVDDRIVHSSWVTTDRAWTREIRAHVGARTGTAYVYESYTDPAVRGQGVYPYALTNICGDVANRGIKKLWVAVEASNPASQRAIAKVGFIVSGQIPFRRRLGWLSTGSALEVPEAPKIMAKRS